GVGERAQLLRPPRIAGTNDQEPAGGRAADRVRVSRERDLPQRMLQVLREGEVACGQRRRPRRVERRRLFRHQLRVGQEERLAIDPVPAKLPLVEPLRIDVLERHAQLEKLGLVTLELALGRSAGAAILVGKQIAQLRERDGLPRVEQERDEVQKALRLLHQLVLIAGSSSAHWMAATLSPGISTFFPASGPSSVPITK